jgi:hypothetical protein
VVVVVVVVVVVENKVTERLKLTMATLGEHCKIKGQKRRKLWCWLKWRGQ